MSETLFTPAAVLDLLTNIDELKDLNIGITETLDGVLQLQVGESIYELNSESATQIDVDESAVDAVSEANMEAYENLASSGDIALEDDPEAIQSGIIKELAKSLLLGGMIRLSAKILKG